MLCRDCLSSGQTPPRCQTCGKMRLLDHPELMDLSIAHVDCDAFYASVEKREDPSLIDKPVIVGGGQRGVVTTACYIARLYGVRSAMPMFEARKKCPDAVVVPPRFALYTEVSRAIRAKMDALTPAVEPLSLDEAFLDLTGTARLHGTPPAQTLVRFAKEVRDDIGITLSVGLSHNKFLAKIASDLKKPDGFSVIGRAETQSFLEPQPVGIIWGVGAATRTALQGAGIETIADLKRWDQKALMERFGQTGYRLYDLARGIDTRRVKPDRDVKSVSNETTFATDIGDLELLEAHLYRLCEKTSSRAKAQSLVGSTVTLKVKTPKFQSITRQTQLRSPTQSYEDMFAAARPLLRGVLDKGPFRLIGVGISHLQDASRATQTADLLDHTSEQNRRVEAARDQITAKFGQDAIRKGRGL